MADSVDTPENENNETTAFSVAKRTVEALVAAETEPSAEKAAERVAAWYEALGPRSSLFISNTVYLEFVSVHVNLDERQSGRHIAKESAMICSQRQLTFYTACEGGPCVAVGFHRIRRLGCHSVHVRSTQYPARVVKVRRSRWDRLVRDALITGNLDLHHWFPSWRYGNFASTFTEAEAVAFLRGLLARDPHLLGTATAS
jgi:hypothetical protein